MIKPLLKVIPALSGNVKLACNLDNYKKINDDEFSAIVREARLYPLSSNMYQHPINVSLLRSSWEYDITNFYAIYSDIFYKNTFSYDKSNILKIDSLTNVINDRSVDFDFGCKRVSYKKTGTQFNFFAPIYCDNVNDLPDYFEIVINIKSENYYNITKKIRVDISKESTNYLSLYLKRYISKIDDNVIYLMPNSSQAVYYGIDVQIGGLNKYIDNVISKNFLLETTVNSFDACICDGFKRNHLIMRQILPLAFYFNVNDILTDVERIKYKNATLKIMGSYYKDNKALPFYIFDDNYNNLSLPTLSFDNIIGKMKYIYNYNNLFEISDKLSISSNNVAEYKFSNKINKFYTRWMLKYSSNENPYITNNNYLFSANQKLQNQYYQYPQNYFWTTGLCNIQNNTTNLILPIGDNIDTFYNAHNYLVNKYQTVMDNYITNWFDIIENNNIEDIINSVNWGNVYKDGKIFYKGLLYDFNKIYNVLPNVKHIDKFAILMYLNTDELYDNTTVSKYIYSQQVLTHSPIKTGISTNLTPNNYTYNTYTYTFEKNSNISLVVDNITINSSYTNDFYKYDNNMYFTYNAAGLGKYINLEDIQIDYYDEFNCFRKIQESKLSYFNDSHKTNKYIIESYELLEIPFIGNIYDIINDLRNSNCIYYSNIGNSNNMVQPISTLDINNITDDSLNTFYNYTFYQKGLFIHNSHLTDTLDDSTYIYSEAYYNFHPQYVLDNNNILYNIFTRVDTNNKFYGNSTSYTHIDVDNDVLYIDPYNIYNQLNDSYTITGNMYISNINYNTDNVEILLSDLYNDLTYTTVYIDNSDVNIILTNLCYTDTYSYYFNNKYNVNKLITGISGVITDNGISYIYNNSYYTIDTIDNKYKNSSYIDVYAYGSYIDYTTYSITLKNYNNQTIYCYCGDLETTYNTAYNCQMISYVKLINDTFTYRTTHNGIGTYYFTYSYLFGDHPQYLIKQIRGLSYIIPENLNVNNGNNIIITYITPNTKFDIIKFNEYNNEIISYYNPDIQETSIEIQSIGDFILNQYETKNAVRFAKIKNLTHLKIIYSLICDNKNCLYYKIHTIYDTNNLYIRDNFVEISNINNIVETKDDYLFDIIINDSNIIKNVEIYYKKQFIKLNKSIYDNIIRLNSNQYTDLYIYRMEKDNDISPVVKYNYNTTYDIIGNTYSSYMSLVPFFNDIYREQQYNTVIYNSYIINNVSPVRFYNNDTKKDIIMYRYNMPDKLFLYDISNIFSYTTNSYNLIYNIPNNNYVAYSYQISNENGDIITVYDTSKKVLLNDFAYYTANIPTYDIYTIQKPHFNNLTYSNDNTIFEKYKLNTYTYNGVNYGFYYIEMPISNINSLFNITFNNMEYVKYFTSVNGTTIINNTKYLTKVFKYLIPFMKINILNNLYDIPLLNGVFKTTFNKQYYNYVNNDIKHIGVYKDKTHESITLYRYYDNIIPYIYETNNVYTDYMLKTTLYKQMPVLETDSIYYTAVNNIYNYPGIRVYKDANTVDDISNIKQIEYKYYNDNQFINLEPEITIHISDTLLFNDIIKYQSNDVIFSYFKKYINKQKNIKFSDDEMLFLYNKYSVIIYTNPIKLANNFNEKNYSLTYKFNLN